MAWQSALLVTVLLILNRVYRRRSARFLHAVWLLILIRLVIPPATSFPTGIGWWVRPATTQTVSASDRRHSDK
jgi:beta-lactamase regulating signal transducer with metallopeptidase domain